MNDNICLEFSKPFNLEKYGLFLKAKKLPEYKLRYDWQTGYCKHRKGYVRAANAAVQGGD